MAHSLPHRLWHTAREYASHWMVAGVIVAATGTAPEHWFAELVTEAHLPEEILHLGAAGIDLRLVLVAAGLLLIAGDIVWRRTRPAATFVPITEQTAPLALPEKPSIAVLPFNNLSGNGEQDYFSDGMAEDIITELSRSHHLFVIARNSSFIYKGRTVDVKQVARELGVRYVLEGSVRHDGDRIRLTAQLINAQANSHVWAERYDRSITDIFAVQDEITRAVTVAIEPAISQAELQRALRKPPGNLDAWEAYQHGLWHLSKSSHVDINEASVFFRRSIALDPAFATSHAMLGYVLVWDLAFGQVRDFQSQTLEAAGEARRALELDPDDAIAHAVLSWAGENTLGAQDRGLPRAQRAVAISPNNVTALLILGRTLAFAGRPREALEPLGNAMRHSPHDPLCSQIMMTMALSHYLARDFAAAAEISRATITAYPALPLTYRWLAAALGQLGAADAPQILKRAMDISPEAFDFFVRQRPPWFTAEDHQLMLEGLCKAGWKG